jgi:uncharacterized protein (DUF58 family)
MTADALALPSARPLDAGTQSAWRTVLHGPVVLSVVVGSILRIVWRWAHPFFAVISPVGWLVLLIGLGSLAVSAMLGWEEFFFLGATTLAAIVVSVAFVFGRSTYAVRIELNPRRVVVGEKALGSITTTNTGRKKVLVTRMELPIGASAAEFTIPQLAPEESNEELFTVPTHRRAVIVAGPAVSVRGDQLGLLRRAVKWTEPMDLFVHPLTTRLASSAAGLVRDLEGQVSKKVTNSDISFHALRNYVPGDDRRYVHWRTSARTGQLMVRQFEETRRSQLIVIHSAAQKYYASDDEFELAVSVTASIAQQVIRDGTQLNVVSERLTLRTHSDTAMLDDSCRLGPVEKSFDTARAFARETTRRLPAPSVVMIVGGSRMTTVEMRSIESLFPVDTTVVGIRVDAGGHPRFSTVAGLRVLSVGSLSDLPKLLRRAA